jgi:hypothetical protein
VLGPGPKNPLGNRLLAPFLCALTLSAACDSVPKKKQEKSSPKNSAPAQVAPAEESEEADGEEADSKDDAARTAGDEQPAAAASATPPEDEPRVYAKSRHVWIRSMPTSKVQWIGYLWWGGSAKIRDEKRVPGAGCKKEWVPVQPRGWVCVDDVQATTDPKDPELVAIYPYQPQVESPWPHKYAAVHAPLRRYEELPDEKRQKSWERGYERHFAAVKEARESGSIEHFPDLLGKLDPSLSGKEPPSFPTLPKGLSEGATRIVGRSAMTYVAEADYGDRTFLLTGDLGWVPKDRVELLEPKEFKGVELGEKLKLPIAFFKGKARPGFLQQGDGSFKEVPKKFARHSVLQLENEIVRDGHTRYYKVAGEDLWVSSKQAVIPTPREKTPWGATVGKPDDTGRERKGRATWLEASILGGWLVAFEGTKAVYATMISAGRGGKPHPDKDPLETASTPTGRFSIGGKFKTATMMSSSTPIVHTDVPWTQNFSGPHAIHSAYWHDDWGDLKSAGCVNVSPRDGKWLFGFTEPDVPEGWHGVRYVARYGGGSTLFVVHE